MRVLHLISSGGMYGAEAVILNLSLALEASGSHHSQVAVFEHDQQSAPELHKAAERVGVRSHLLSCGGQIDPTFPGRLRDLVSSTGADVLHVHGYKADIYAHAALRGGRTLALVSTCHTWYDNNLSLRLYGAADRWVLRDFDEVVAVSPEVRDRLLTSGVSEGRVHLIRNGIGLAPFAAERDFAPQGRPLTVGLVGRLAPEKGVDTFLRAVARVKDAFPEARFVVAGEGDDRLALQTLLAELGLENRAALVGAQADMPAFYRSVDLLVSASRQEGLPMALLEGMAAALPVVATRVGAVPEVVVHGETGLLVQPGAPEQLADSMIRLLNSPSLRRQFGEASRRRIQEHFSAERMTSDYLQVYERALRRVHGPARSGAQR